MRLVYVANKFAPSPASIYHVSHIYAAMADINTYIYI